MFCRADAARLGPRPARGSRPAPGPPRRCRRAGSAGRGAGAGRGLGQPIRRGAAPASQGLERHLQGWVRSGKHSGGRSPSGNGSLVINRTLWDCFLSAESKCELIWWGVCIP